MGSLSGSLVGPSFRGRTARSPGSIAWTRVIRLQDLQLLGSQGDLASVKMVGWKGVGSNHVCF